MDVEAVRGEFPVVDDCVWMQNGGVSITPHTVAKVHDGLMRELLVRGPMHILHPEEELPRRQATMGALAEFFGVKPSELAVVRGVSEAIHVVLLGLRWQSGDEIIVTADEEAAVLLPALHLRDQHGVKVIKLPLHDDTAKQIEALESCLSGQTRLIAISHVTTDLGVRLPIRQVCEIARARGILTFVDVAQSAGLFPLNLHEVGCDFAGILSYKWMYAPYASGLLYVRGDQLDALQVPLAGGRSEAWLDFAQDKFALHETAERFQYGPWSWPLIHAWAAAADWLRNIGLDAIDARTADLAGRLKEAIQARPEADLLTPFVPERSAALVSFSIADWKGEALAQQLRQRWNIVVKPLPHTREGIRVSVAFFLTEAEIDLLVAALDTLIAEGPPQ